MLTKPVLYFVYRHGGWIKGVGARDSCASSAPNGRPANCPTQAGQTCIWVKNPAWPTCRLKSHAWAGFFRVNTFCSGEAIFQWPKQYTNIDWCRGQHWKIMPRSCVMLPEHCTTKGHNFSVLIEANSQYLFCYITGTGCLSTGSVSTFGPCPSCCNFALGMICLEIAQCWQVCSGQLNNTVAAFSDQSSISTRMQWRQGEISKHVLEQYCQNHVIGRDVAPLSRPYLCPLALLSTGRLRNNIYCQWGWWGLGPGQSTCWEVGLELPKSLIVL